MADSHSPVLANIASFKFHSPKYSSSVVRKNGQTKPEEERNDSKKITDRDCEENDGEDEGMLEPSKTEKSTSGGIDSDDNEPIAITDSSPSDEPKNRKNINIIESDSDEDSPITLTKSKQSKIRKRARISSESSQDTPDSPPWIGKSRIPFGSSTEKSKGIIHKSRDRILQHRDQTLHFFNKATPDELMNIPRCNLKMAEMIKSKRRFHSYDVLVEVFEETKGLSVCVVEDYLDSLEARANLERLLAECGRRSTGLQDAVQNLGKESEEGYIEPPSLLASELELKPYQKIGLNWLALMHRQKMNAILADEMGLGKTIQVIAFLAHLRETQKQRSVHLIVVPSSTIDNWGYELKRWWPSVKMLNYYGAQDDRAQIRYELTKGKYRDKDIDVLLTTYNMVQGSF